MSGPKVSEYTYDASVLRAAEEERRAQEEQLRREQEFRRIEKAKNAIDAAKLSLSHLQAKMEDARQRFPHDPIDVNIPVMPAVSYSSAAELEAYGMRLNSVIDTVELALKKATDRAEGNAALRTLLVDVGKAIRSQPKTASEVIAVISAATSHAERSDLISKLISPLGNSPVPPELDKIVARILAARAQEINGLELELRLQVQAINKVRTRQERDYAESKKLYSSLPADSSAELDEIRSELIAVACHQRGLDDALRRKVFAVQQRAEQRAMDARVSQLVEQSLQSLGYDIGERFSTLFVEGGEAYFQRPEWGSYFVALNVNRDDKLLNLRMVRSDSGAQPTRDQKRRDKEMEEIWCGEYTQVIDRIRLDGIGVKQLRALPPGAKPVQVLRDAKQKASKRRTSTTSRAQQAK